MTEILPVYEQTKQAMNFDPDGMTLVFGPPENWDLHRDHPLTVMDRIFDLADKLGWTQEQLEQERKWMSWLLEQERGENGDAQTWTASTSDEHTELKAGVDATGGETQHPIPPGKGRKDSGGEDGKAKSLSRRRGKAPDLDLQEQGASASPGGSA